MRARVMKKRPSTTSQMQISPESTRVKEVMLQAIEEYVRLTGERKVHYEDAYVVNLAEHRVIFYGTNAFEKPVAEYSGPHGYWRCWTTTTLRLKGEPFVDRYRTQGAAQGGKGS